MRLFAGRRKTFPPPTETGPEGAPQISDEISVDVYSKPTPLGIFPWPAEGDPILRFSPPARGVINFADFHEPRSLRKWMRQNDIGFDLEFQI